MEAEGASKQTGSTKYMWSEMQVGVTGKEGPLVIPRTSPSCLCSGATLHMLTEHLP